MDRALKPSRAAPADLRIEGRISHAVPFAKRHLHDPSYLAWVRDYEVVKTLNLTEYLTPVSFAQVKAYFDAMMASDRDLLLALYYTPNDAFIGTLKAGHIDGYAGTADLGIMIGRRDYWGRGIATDAIWTFSRYLFEALGLRKLTAGAMATNPAMIRVFEKLGFRREGVLRRQDRLADEEIDHILFGCFPDELEAAG